MWSHAWTVRITDDLNNNDVSAEGAPTTAGNPFTLVSLLAEDSSALAILYFLQAICKYYNINTSESSVKIWIDNMEVINIINSFIQQNQHAKFSMLDYDQWSESQQVIDDGLPFW